MKHGSDRLCEKKGKGTLGRGPGRNCCCIIEHARNTLKRVFPTLRATQMMRLSSVAIISLSHVIRIEN